jgi:hypothetical protein
MTDIVERLRDIALIPDPITTAREAADEIERLRAELANETDLAEMRLKQAGKHFAETCRLESEIERLRKLPDILADEIERLRGIPDWKIGEGKPRDVRSDALEDAAKIGDDYGFGSHIRALKEAVDD